MKPGETKHSLYLGGGESRREVGVGPRSKRRRYPPHPPIAIAMGPSLSLRKRAERGKRSRPRMKLWAGTYSAAC